MTEQITPYRVHINGHKPVDTGEPLDRLDNRDVATIRGALDVHYKNMLDCGASLRDLERVRALSRRLTDVGVTWVAEEAAP